MMTLSCEVYDKKRCREGQDVLVYDQRMTEARLVKGWPVKGRLMRTRPGEEHHDTYFHTECAFCLVGGPCAIRCLTSGPNKKSHKNRELTDLAYNPYALPQLVIKAFFPID